MLVVGILLIVAVIAWIDLPRLWRKKQKKDLSVYLILLLIGTGFSIAEGLNWDIPNPMDWLIYVYRPVGEWIFHQL